MLFISFPRVKAPKASVFFFMNRLALYKCMLKSASTLHVSALAQLVAPPCLSTAPPAPSAPFARRVGGVKSFILKSTMDLHRTCIWLRSMARTKQTARKKQEARQKQQQQQDVGAAAGGEVQAQGRKLMLAGRNGQVVACFCKSVTSANFLQFYHRKACKFRVPPCIMTH